MSLPTVLDILGDFIGDRVYMVRAPKDVALPYAVLTQVTGERGITYQGPDGLSQADIQVDIYAEKYAETITLASDMIAALEALRQAPIRLIEISTIRDLPAADVGGVRRLYRRQFDATIHQTET